MYEIYWLKNRNLRKRCRNVSLKDGLMIEDTSLKETVCIKIKNVNNGTYYNKGEKN